MKGTEPMRVCSLTYTESAGWSQPIPTWLDSPSTIAFVFGAPECRDEDVLVLGMHDIHEALPRSVVTGCSTAGEIHGTRIRDRSLSVAIARFDGARVAFASAPVDATSSRSAGELVARDLDAPDLRSVHVLSDGLHINGSELVRGLNTVLSPEVVTTGGLAGDGARFGRTWVLDRGAMADSRVTAVGIYGNGVRAGHGSRGGWDIFGPERRVTRSIGNVLYELDGRPALELYKRYLGEQAAGLPSTALLFPLALRTSKTDGKTLVRTVLSVDDETSSMTFAGDIPQGALAQLMHANFDRLIDGANGAALATQRSPDGQDSLTIAVSCVGRRLVLGERAEEEVEAVAASLPDATSLVGFYSYGEISPYATGHCDLHNQTMTLTHLWEELD